MFHACIKYWSLVWDILMLIYYIMEWHNQEIHRWAVLELIEERIGDDEWMPNEDRENGIFHDDNWNKSDELHDKYPIKTFQQNVTMIYIQRQMNSLYIKKYIIESTK